MSNILTINIENTDLRFLVSDGKKIKEWGSIPLEKGAVREGVVLNFQALNVAISELIASTGFKKGRVLASLSGIQSIHRIISLPKTPDKFQADAIVSEVQKAMPVSVEQLYFSWQALGRKGDETQFFVLGVPRGMADSQAQCLRRASIPPHNMNLKPVALARMINRANALIIDLESESSTIIVVADGVPIVIRTLITSPESSSLSRAEHAFVELERTLQFYESSLSNTPINAKTPLFLTGKLAGESELYQTVAFGAGYSVETLETPQGCPADLPLAQFAANIGLASLESPNFSRQPSQLKVNNLNSLPDIYRPRKLTTQERLAIAGAVAGLVLLIPLYLVVDSASGDTGKLNAEDNRLQQQIVSQQVKVREADQIAADLKQSISQMEKEYQNTPNIIAFASEIKAKRQRTCDDIAKAFQMLPVINGGESSLSSVALNGNQLILEGQVVLDIEAYSDASNKACEFALNYADGLEGQTDMFSEVHVDSLNKQGITTDETGAPVTESVKFKLTLTLKDILIAG